MINKFLVTPKVFTGANSLVSTKNIYRDLGTKALIVTDKMMVELKNVNKLLDLLTEVGVDYFVYNEVNFEPTTQLVKDGVDIYKRNNCDFLIALGGGSVIDTAKAIAMMSNENDDLPMSFFMGKEFDKVIPAIVAIPTTAGTGSEATKFTIITDAENDVKMLLKGESLMPRIAVIDPLFTLTVPKSVTVATGVDALCHAVEAYISKLSQPLSNTFAISAIKRIFTNLLVCAEEPKNERAREEMSIAAFEAGIAFNNSSVTIVHGMSRPIGALYHVPHGYSNAILLLKCLEYIEKDTYRKFAEIARQINLTDLSDDKACSRIFMDSLKEMLKKLNVKTLSDFNVDKEKFYCNIPKMAEDAYQSGSPSNLECYVSVEEMQEIYKSLF